jgi:hypothetical protein
MKAGVSTSPWRVVMMPSLAPLAGSFLKTLKENDMAANMVAIGIHYVRPDIKKRRFFRAPDD